MDSTHFFQMNVENEFRFVEAVCLPLLRSAQNPDGGWGFHPGSESRAEPTGWALQALLQFPGPEAQMLVSRGFQFLRSSQRPDGSWAFVSGGREGSWVTALACWALLAEQHSADAVSRGLDWLCKDWPRDSAPWRRILAKFSKQRDINPINNSYRGWGWTPGTSSWVEPTATILIVLGECPPELRPSAAAKRQELAEAMLRDRMCPGGGWNCGNPSVYGVAGEPLVIPTVWALLALRNQPEQPETVSSLDWLLRNTINIRGLGSLVLTRLCLEAYGREWPGAAPTFKSLHQRSGSLNIPVAAWTCLAASPRHPFALSRKAL